MDDNKGKGTVASPMSGDIRLPVRAKTEGRERTLAVALAVEQAHSAGLKAENDALRAELASQAGALGRVDGVYERAFDRKATSFGLPAGLGGRQPN